MPQSLAAIYLHLVFSTKGRRPFLREPVMLPELHAFLGGVSKQVGCAPVRVGGVEDHVHLLGRLGRTIPVADWVKELKRVSHRWLTDRRWVGDDFAWQGGYAVFSVSRSRLEQVTSYIERQAEHHRKVRFADELRALLQRHGMEWDERYVWD